MNVDPRRGYAVAKGIVAAVAMAAIGEESSLDVAAWRKEWDAAG